MTKLEECVNESTKRKRNELRKNNKLSSNETVHKIVNKNKEIDELVHETLNGTKVKKTLKDDVKCISKKKPRKQSRAEEQLKSNEESEDENEDDLHEPSVDELRESAKPENVKALITVRQKKKQKHLKRLETRRDETKDKEKQRNAEYLEKWKNAHTTWKFEKLRQISIQSSMFDEQKLDRHVWPVALEYLSASKGAAKVKLCTMAEAVIDELDSQCEKLNEQTERQKILDSTRYQRARELLQNIDQ